MMIGLCDVSPRVDIQEFPMAQRNRSLAQMTPWIVVLLGLVGPWQVRGAPPGADGLVIRLESGHPWRPPFGLKRIGQPCTTVIELSQPPRHSGYELTVLHQGKEVGRHRLNFTTEPPYSATITVTEYGDELVLSAGKDNEAGRVEVARQPIRIPRIELDAVALPDGVTNPVDLGTILVPHGWLLLGPGQGGGLDIAAICRDRDELDARVRAFFGSAPGRETSVPVALKRGRKQGVGLQAPRAFEDARSRCAPGRARRWPGKVARGKVDSGNAGAEAPALAPVWRRLHQAALRRADLGP